MTLKEIQAIFKRCSISEWILEIKSSQDHFSTASNRATYRSKTTQNQLISLCGNFRRDQILAEVRLSGWYTISADEATDNANHEQLTLVLRFCDEHSNIREEFMEFVVCHSTTGENLADIIIKKITEDWNLPMEKCRGQTYDGAGNMAGSQRGTASRIQRQYPKAIYTHCFSHKLNLAVVKTMTISDVRNMMDTGDKLVRFYKNSPKRQHNLETWIDERYHGEAEKKNLKELCKTRWVARHDAFNVFIDLHEAIVNSLQDISTHAQEWNRPSISDAQGLLTAITQFQFIAALKTTRDVIAYVQPMSLQSRIMDIVKANKQIKHVIAALVNIRGKIDDFHHTLFQGITTMAQTVGVEPSRARVCGRQRNRANAPTIDIEEHYKINLTIPVVDQLIASMQDIFGEQQVNVTCAFFLVPAVIQDLSLQEVIKNVEEFAEQYKDDLPSPQNISAELHCWVRRWKDADKHDDLPQDAVSTLKAADASFFPNVHVIMRLLCTFAVSSAECERSFSSLKRLKTYMRSRMVEDRLNGLAQMHVHNNKNVDIDTIINNFARNHPRRMSLANILSD